jgi:protein SCO1/2
MTDTTSTDRGFLRNPLVWYFFVGIVVLTLIRPMLRREPQPPPVIGQLPQYSLLDTRGRPFGSDELAGQVYVANFIFTRCTSICPLLTRAMATLQQRYDDENIEGIRLVSITIDPEFDTPEKLAEYATAHQVDTQRWTFLTGTQAQIVELVEKGFKTAVGQPELAGNDLIDIAHSGHLVIVDGQGGIRGYYGSDARGLDEVFHRSQHVLAQQRH